MGNHVEESIEQEKKDLGPIEELTAANDLIQYILTIQENLGSPISHEGAKKIVDSILADNKGDITFFGMKDRGGKMVATGRLTVKIGSDGSRYGFLSGLSVHRDLRGKGIGKKIVEERNRLAKERGCTHMATETFCDNPQAIATKLHDGFCIQEVIFDLKNKKNSFVLTKKIDQASQPETLGEIVAGTESKQYKLSELEAIRALLNSGQWEGVDIRPTNSPKSSNPEEWVLFMRKNKGVNKE